MTYPFTYKVTFLTDDYKKENTRCGIGFADSFTSAAEIIEDYYGNTLLSIDRIYLMEEGNLIEIPEEEMKRIENDGSDM